ncbi:hypothetical protein CL619_02110 [archaeon]|nr:hypothetical protein [archaeon]|tara:strand:+ start:1740 stop:3044 length:1305 start_codon:yes stop_codon:yes gene_type:complete
MLINEESGMDRVSTTNTINSVVIVGLGYVGLPLALKLSAHFSVIGFDVSDSKISHLKQGVDVTKQHSSEEITKSGILFTSSTSDILKKTVYILCVPTPIDQYHQPDLSFIRSAGETVGKCIGHESVVVLESTVYPGVTEEILAPILEKNSGLKLGEFGVAYSPERVNPGDANHTIDKIIKIVSASDQKSLEKIQQMYSQITQVYVSPSIKVAESAKVIENIQRDLNIALVNELTCLFDRLDVNVHEVLKAAGTKWNFHNYKPGLVGGHCIGVDPYYLTHKAKEVGFHSEIILAGRRVNDNMHVYCAQRILKKLYSMKRNNNIGNNGNNNQTNNHSILIMGLTFKKNVADYRNSRVKELISELKKYNVTIYGYDPYISEDVIQSHFGIKCATLEEVGTTVDLVIPAVEHREISSSLSTFLAASNFRFAEKIFHLF